MSYYDQEDLINFGFNYLGENVKVSQHAKIYDPGKISLGSNSRIDDFCIVSGSVTVGCYCHITPMCLVAGGVIGIVMGDFVTLAYGTKVFAQSDDYSGRSMVNSLIPKKFKNEFKSIIEALFSLLHNNREERYKRFNSLLTHISLYSCEKTHDKNAARLLQVTHHHTLIA